jgi:hypothetical protein
MKKRRFKTSSTKGNTALKNANSSQALLPANEGYTDDMTADRTGMHRRG